MPRFRSRAGWMGAQYLIGGIRVRAALLSADTMG